MGVRNNKELLEAQNPDASGIATIDKHLTFWRYWKSVAWSGQKNSRRL
jgi:hypothetical protein